MPTAQSSAADAHALEHARTGAIFGIVGILLSVVGTYLSFAYGGLSLGISCNSVTETCSIPSAAVALLGGLFALEVVGTIIGILFVLKFRSAFQTLVPVDYRFRSPASLSILLVIGFILIVLGEGVLFATVANIIGQCSNLNTTNCYNAATGAAGALLASLGVLVLGAILALIGGILLLVGIWRLGTRYDDSLLKVGAVLLIIPFLDIAGIFLIYFGVTQAQGRLASAGGLSMPGASPPFAPPPGAP